MPGLDLYARACRGGHLLLRKRYQAALPWLEECLGELPRAQIGYGNRVAALARAYNALGEHERARAACLPVLTALEPGDLAVAGLTLHVQLELLVAQAGLGEGEQATFGLDALLAQHAPHQGPLTLGELHTTGLEIALVRRDETRLRQHAAEAQRWYRGTGVPSLVQYADELQARAALFFAADEALASRPGGAGNTATSVGLSVGDTAQRLLGGGSLSTAELAKKALQLLAENTRANAGFLYLLDDDDQPALVASLRQERPSEALTRWLGPRIAGALEDEKTQLLDDAADNAESDVFVDGERRYRLLVLTAPTARSGVLGVALVGTDGVLPPHCPGEVLGAVAYHLQRAATRTQP
jgi:hypothetical protein